MAHPDGTGSASIPGGPWAVFGPGGAEACVPGGPCRVVTP